MVASQRLYLALVAISILFCGALISPIFVGLGIGCDAILFLLVLADFIVTPGPKNLTGSRIVQDRLSIGRRNLVEVAITNLGSQTFKCKVRDSCPVEIKANISDFEFNLEPASVAKLDYELAPRRRGLYKFGKIHLRYLSKFGLFWRQIKLGEDRAIKVYSDLQSLKELSMKLASSTELGELRRNKRGQGTDFASLKEYTSGDDSKSIDWKATARRDKPIVRTYEIEQEQRLLILIDAGRMMVSNLENLSRFDHALNAALGLALTGLTHNDQVGLGIFAEKPLLFMPPRRGKAYLQKILDATFPIEPRSVEPDYPGMLAHYASLQKNRALVVVLTDLTDPAGSQALLEGLVNLRKRHLPMCVTLNDRTVLEIGQKRSISPTENLEASDIYQRAVALDLVAQRELALTVLQRQGCLVLDKPPQELSAKLIDLYLDVKRRGLL
jgi:uncharacterized protein (DUF58 family)